MLLRLVAIIGTAFFASLGSAASVMSPDGRVTVTIEVRSGQLHYQVKLDDSTVLHPSPLGLVTSVGDFSRSLKVVDDVASESVDGQYDLSIGKTSGASYRANRGGITVANPQEQRMSVIVQVSNDGVALAYQLHLANHSEVVVERELTGFALPKAAHSYLHPMHVARSGWMRTNPSYEAHYEIDQPVGQASPDGQGWCFPALFRIPSDDEDQPAWLLVSETGVDGSYCGTHLAHESPEGVYTIAFPQPEENLPTDPVAPTVAGDARLPWRIMILGDSLAPIVESTLATDLVEPKFTANDPPQPGLAAWSWVFLKDGQTVYQTQREFIDMAAELGLEYVLIDSMWDQQIGREKIAELVEYARSKSVGVLLWYNSNGNWNDAPQTPKNRMHEPEVRATEMAWLRDIGVKGIKVDFFGGDKQAGMQFYEQLLVDANRFGLSINFHGTTLPRGWHRMYPTFVTNEAVMGMEFVTFDQRNADRQAQHCTILPFTRNVVGPMDFTPTILSRRLAPGNRGPRRRTTDGFELALPVLFFSGIQHLGITPGQMADQPGFVHDYLGQLPATWDETRYVAGHPGEYAVLARRSGDRWYVAAINGTNEPRKVAVDLAFANARAWTMLHDTDDGLKQTSASVADGMLTLTLPAQGGATLWTDQE